MSKTRKFRLNLFTDGRLYKMLSCWQGGDGSLYLVVDRRSRGTASLGSSGKGLRVSYHVSGRVNCHDLPLGGPRYFQPLPFVSMVNPIFVLALTSADQLDGDSAPNPETSVLEVERIDPPGIAVQFAIVPLGFEVHGLICRLDFDRFAVALLRTIIPEWAPTEPELRVFANVGLYDEQQLPQREAELAYVQAGRGPELVVAGPNGEGVYTLYTGVVMRDTPKLTIEFISDLYSVEVLQRSEPHKLLMRIFDRNGVVRATDLRPLIKSITLNARFT